MITKEYYRTKEYYKYIVDMIIKDTRLKESNQLINTYDTNSRQK